MTPEEADLYFQKLSSILEERGMDWVVQQVREEIARGKLETRKVKTTEYDDSERVVGAKASRSVTGTFTGAVEYSSQEQLELILNAVEQVFISSAAMNRDIPVLLGPNQPMSLRIEFRDETARTRQVIATPEIREFRNGMAQTLAPLIAELRREVYAD